MSNVTRADTGYRLGLVSVSFRRNTPAEIVAAARDAGLECIEWGSDIHAPCDDHARLSEIASLQRESGLYCSSYGTYFRLGESDLSELDRYISAAAILGTRILRVWCGNKSGDKYSESEREEFLAECRRAAAIAERAGAVLCTECHKNTFTERLCDAEWLFDSVASPNFRSYWQPFQWQSADDNLAYARAISARCEHIHVFNWKGSERFPLGYAIDEWRDYLSAFSTPRTLLLEFMPDDGIAELSREAEALRKITGPSK